MIRPDVGKVILNVVNQLGGSVVGTVVPDAEYCRVCSVRVGLDEGVWCKEPVGGIDYQVKREDDLFAIRSAPLEVMFRSHLNGTGFGESKGD